MGIQPVPPGCRSPWGEQRMRRRAELESQIAALREANQRLEERVAIQDEALAECARA